MKNLPEVSGIAELRLVLNCPAPHVMNDLIDLVVGAARSTNVGAKAPVRRTNEVAPESLALVGHETVQGAVATHDSAIGFGELSSANRRSNFIFGVSESPA